MGNGLFASLDLSFELILNGGQVFTYTQTYKGLPVFRAELFVKLDRQNSIRHLFNSTFPIQNLVIPNLVDEMSAQFKVRDHLDAYSEVNFTKSTLGVLVVSGEPQIVWEMSCTTLPGLLGWKAYVHEATNKILSLECTSEFAPIDGQGNVFNPSPTYSAQQPYGSGGLTNNNHMTNSDLDEQLMSVTLKDIDYDGQYYRLSGPNVLIEDPNNDYRQTTSNFSFDRSHLSFEAVNAYYHIDKSMRYVHDEIGVELRPFPNEPVRVIPRTNTNTRYEGSNRKIYFNEGSVNNVESAEDAFVILHELGHGLHAWAGLGTSFRIEGANEGIADYWGQSETRDCGVIDDYPEWDHNYHIQYHWSGSTGALATDFGVDYCTEDPGTWWKSNGTGFYYSRYTAAQFLSTVLFKIRNDIGKLQCDKLFIESLAVLRAGRPEGGHNNFIASIQEAGVYIYEAAQQMQMDPKNLCIIHNHLVESLCIDQNEYYDGPPTGISRDYFIRDSECDMGIETNEVSTYIWQSDDIWVRNTADGKLEHQNPRYQGTEPNTVYVRIRGRGCDVVPGTKLHLYFNRGSSSPVWPGEWNNFYRTYPLDGTILEGDEITSAIGFTVPYIAPGDELILPFSWVVSPGPVYSIPLTLNFNLLARLVTPHDPMHTTEVTSVPRSTFNNAKNNNNIAWKNMSILTKTNPLVAEVVAPLLLLGEDFGAGGSISMEAGNCYLNTSISQRGDFFIKLDPTTHQAWVQNGQQGQSFQLMPDQRIKVLNENFKLEGMYTTNNVGYLTVTYDPINESKHTSFNLIVNNSQDNVVGGHTFLYRGMMPPQSSGRKSNTDEGLALNSIFTIFPNPVSNTLYLRGNFENPIVEIRIHKTDGTLALRQQKDTSELVNEIDISALALGLYIMHAHTKDSELVKKFVKH